MGGAPVAPPPPIKDETVHVKYLTAEALDVPVIPFQYDPNICDRIHVLSRRQARQRDRIKRKRQRRAFHREHPWQERYPSLAFVVFWTMVLAVPVLYILTPG